MRYVDSGRPLAALRSTLTAFAYDEQLDSESAERVADFETLLVQPASDDGGDQPLLWTQTRGGARIVATTLGHSDFQADSARRVLLNGILWALDLEVPEDGSVAKPTPPVD